MPSSTKEALARLSRKSKGGIVSVEQAAAALELSTRLAATRLASLRRQGWLKRVRRGLYFILPLETESGQSIAVEDSWVLARELYKPCYIGGWSAAEHWELTEQLFRSTFVVTAANIRSTDERVLSSEFHLVRVAADRLRGTTSIWRGRERVAVSDRERTLADGFVSPDWVGGVRHLVDMTRNYRDMRSSDLKKIAAHLKAIERGAGFKRFGYLVETLWPQERGLVDDALTQRSLGVIKLDPSVRVRGRLNKRWGLWINVQLPDASAA